MGLLFLLLVLDDVLPIEVIVLVLLLLVWVTDNNNAVSLLRGEGGLVWGAKDEVLSTCNFTGDSGTWDGWYNWAPTDVGDALWGEQVT